MHFGNELNTMSGDLKNTLFEVEKEKERNRPDSNGEDRSNEESS